MSYFASPLCSAFVIAEPPGHLSNMGDSWPCYVSQGSASFAYNCGHCDPISSAHTSRSPARQKSALKSHPNVTFTRLLIIDRSPKRFADDQSCILGRPKGESDSKRETAAESGCSPVRALLQGLDGHSWLLAAMTQACIRRLNYCVSVLQRRPERIVTSLL